MSEITASKERPTNSPDKTLKNVFRFEVALSFAGDNKRDKVREVAQLLKQNLGEGKVFFDEWFVAEIAGNDANTVLQSIYTNKTRLVVTCVCKRYSEKPWTRSEWRAIQSFEQKLQDASTDNFKRMRFLPLRFGDGKVDGIFDTAIVPDVRDFSPQEIADLILKRHHLTINPTSDPIGPTTPPVDGTEEEGKSRFMDKYRRKVQYLLPIAKYSLFIICAGAIGTFAFWGNLTEEANLMVSGACAVLYGILYTSYFHFEEFKQQVAFHTAATGLGVPLGILTTRYLLEIPTTDFSSLTKFVTAGFLIAFCIELITFTVLFITKQIQKQSRVIILNIAGWTIATPTAMLLANDISRGVWLGIILSALSGLSVMLTSNEKNA